MSYDIAPELVERMVAHFRAVVAKFPSPATQKTDPLLKEAREIVALLPKPIDPDLIEARLIVVRLALPGRYDGITGFAAGAGDADEKPYTRAVLAAIKRGRELAGGAA